MNERSNEALLARRAIAEKAMPGAFNGENDYYVREQRAGLEHRCANPPRVVIADIDEILRLRAAVKRLNKEADYLAGVIAAAYCAQENVTRCEKTEGLPLHKLRDACASCWRRAAREAVEKNT